MKAPSGRVDEHEDLAGLRGQEFPPLQVENETTPFPLRELIDQSHLVIGPQVQAYPAERACRIH